MLLNLTLITLSPGDVPKHIMKFTHPLSEIHTLQTNMPQISPIHCQKFIPCKQIKNTPLLLFAKKLDKTQIDTKLAHETCAGHISRTTCLIVLVSFVSHSPTCTAGPGALNCHDFYIYPSLASSCLNLRQIEAN